MIKFCYRVVISEKQQTTDVTFARGETGVVVQSPDKLDLFGFEKTRRERLAFTPPDTEHGLCVFVPGR